MPLCSNSDHELTDALAATMDDVLRLASIGTPSFDGSLHVASALQDFQPSLVFLALPDGEITLLDSDCEATDTRIAQDVYDRLPELPSGGSCSVPVESGRGRDVALATSLPIEDGDAVLVCVVSRSAHSNPAGGTEADDKVLMLASLSRLAAANHADQIQLLAKNEQLAAGHEALQESYALSLAQAVEERDERLMEQQEHTSRLQAVMMTAAEGIVTIDASGSIESFNAAATEIFGYRPDEVIGSDVALLFPAGQGAEANAFQKCLSQTGGDRHPCVQELQGQRKDGTTFPLEMAVSDVALQDRVIVTAILRDITQRKTLEGQLVQAQKLESIGQLAAGIAHEINTPTQFIGDNLRFLAEAFRDLVPKMTALAGNDNDAASASTLSSDCNEATVSLDRADLEYLVEEIPRAISQSLEGVERVAKIVRSMKEFSHPGTDEMQTVDLNRAIESTLTVCRNEWKYVADVVTDFVPELPPVTCLPGECNQVFLNLIINASHAIAEALGKESSEKGTITVRTRAAGDWVEIRIADTGTGIPEEARTKIFDPFFTTKRVGRGTGQGLAIARSVVVDKHGGSLTFETETGRGTTFVIRLPQARQEGRGT